MGKLRKKHRWRRAVSQQRQAEETALGDLGAGRAPIWHWRCRQCGFLAHTYRPIPPRGTMLDDDGRDCALRMVYEVMNS